jgi:predicted permease
VRALLRCGLLGLAAVELVLGTWTALFPASFYADVPTVDLTPPYSEHLMRDFGGATLGLALVLAAAGLRPERRTSVVALLAYLAFSAPHLVFHAGHLHGATPVEALALVVLLGASVAGPLALLAVALLGLPPDRTAARAAGPEAPGAGEPAAGGHPALRGAVPGSPSRHG